MEGLHKSSNHHLNINRILLIIIVLVGTVLRFYNYAELPFTFDEFSALFRTRFDNFRDLLYFGVKSTDTHPAGVQVFLYYWVKLVGESEMWVKLPFVLFGIGSVVLVYKLGKEWFNPTVGLFTALFLAVLQYPITYSQLARPYASGLFFSLLMVWFWSRLLFKPHGKRFVDITGYILSAAICSYNHHFSLFLAGLVGISGFLFLNRQNWKQYIGSCILIVILYIPHLPIFFVQLNAGGVEEWLKKPDPDFIFKFFQYILHYSPILMSITVLLVLLAIVFFNRDFLRTNRYRILAFSWFVITYLTGYLYSVYISAVLQFSVLLFVFPFLIFFLFSFYKDLYPVLKVILILLFMSVAIYTLIYGRQHYTMMYKSVYKEILLEAKEFQLQNKTNKIASALYMPQSIRDFYLDRLDIHETDFYFPDSLTNYVHFREFVKEQHADYFILGYSLTPGIEHKLVVEEEYPYLIEKKGWFKGDFYVYAKNNPAGMDYSNPDSVIFYSINTFDTLTEGWDEVELFYQLTNGNNYKEDQILRFNHEFEYSPEFIAKVSDISYDRTNEMLVSVDTYVPLSLVNPALICHFEIDGEIVAWRSSDMKDYVTEPEKRLKVHLGFRLADLDIDLDRAVVYVYFWNRNLEVLYIDEFIIEVREGNPFIYGLYEKF